jgi:hypothetical protein
VTEPGCPSPREVVGVGGTLPPTNIPLEVTFTFVELVDALEVPTPRLKPVIDPIDFCLREPESFIVPA